MRERIRGVPRRGADDTRSASRKGWVREGIHRTSNLTTSTAQSLSGLARGHLGGAGVRAAAVVSISCQLSANNRIPTAVYAYFDANIPQARLGDPRSFVQCEIEEPLPHGRGSDSRWGGRPVQRAFWRCGLRSSPARFDPLAWSWALGKLPALSAHGCRLRQRRADG